MNKNITWLQFTLNATKYWENVCWVLVVWVPAATLLLWPQQNNEKAQGIQSPQQPACEAVHGRQVHTPAVHSLLMLGAY